MFPASKRHARQITGVTVRIRTMTRFHSLSIVTISAALSMTAGLAFAGDVVSADKILSALKPKPLTRRLSTGEQAHPPATPNEASLVDTLPNPHTPSLSLRERADNAES